MVQDRILTTACDGWLVQEIKQTHDALIKEAKELPSDIPDVYDEGAQADLKNAAGDVSLFRLSAPAQRRK